MTYARLSEGALDYDLCRYGGSKLLFRGPRRLLEGSYCAVLGGTETFGRFIERPYPALIEAASGIRMVNFGFVNAGLDVFINDAEVLSACANAQVTVIQILGAHNMSNRFYTVHPRRNDRFLRASPMLRGIYHDVDFTEFNFTRHMLSRLREISEERFALVVEELKTAWVARMSRLVSRLDGQVVLLWLGEHAPEEAQEEPQLCQDPLLVDRDMIAAVMEAGADYVEVVSSDAARAEGVTGMVVPPSEITAASELPGPAVHREIAERLAPDLRRLMQPKGLFRRALAS